MLYLHKSQNTSCYKFTRVFINLVWKQTNKQKKHLFPRNPISSSLHILFPILLCYVIKCGVNDLWSYNNCLLDLREPRESCHPKLLCETAASHSWLWARQLEGRVARITNTI